MNRRRFFEMMLAAAATPPTYVFFGSLWKAQPKRFLTLAEWAKTMDPQGNTPVMANLLASQNEILEDVIWSEPGSLVSPTAHHRNPFMVDHL